MLARRRGREPSGKLLFVAFPPFSRDRNRNYLIHNIEKPREGKEKKGEREREKKNSSMD